MLTTIPRSWLIGAWSATLAIIVGSSAVIGASLSTSAILLVLGLTPVVIMMLLGGARTLTVAEILHAAETKDVTRNGG
jgi:hypothetical protein